MWVRSGALRYILRVNCVVLRFDRIEKVTELVHVAKARFIITIGSIMELSSAGGSSRQDP